MERYFIFKQVFKQAMRMGHLQNSVGCFRYTRIFFSLAKYARVIDTDVFWIEETPINCVQQFIDPIFGNYLYSFFFFEYLPLKQS